MLLGEKTLANNPLHAVLRRSLHNITGRCYLCSGQSETERETRERRDQLLSSPRRAVRPFVRLFGLRHSQLSSLCPLNYVGQACFLNTKIILLQASFMLTICTIYSHTGNIYIY